MNKMMILFIVINNNNNNKKKIAFWLTLPVAYACL